MPNQGFKNKSNESLAVTLIYFQGFILFPWSPGVMLWSHLAGKEQYWILVVSDPASGSHFEILRKSQLNAMQCALIGHLLYLKIVVGTGDNDCPVSKFQSLVHIQIW